MNILMVSNEFLPSIGGVQTHVLELSRAMVRQGHSVYVLTRHNEKSSAAREKIDGVSVHRVALAVNHLVYDWQLMRSAKKIINHHAIDVIHVHGMRPLKACTELSCPVVFTNHTSSFLKRFAKGKKHQQKMLKQLSGVSQVIAPSSILVDSVMKLGYQGAVNFISNGVDIDKFTPGDSSLRAQLGIAATDIVVLFSARLHKVKGTDTLVRALAQLSLPDLHFVVAGDGDERELIQSTAIRELGSENVHMLGGVENAKMADVYRSADFSLLPSLMEATSIAGLEGMACGLPLIASCVGGLPYLIDEGQTGLLIEPENSEELVKAIKLLYSDAGLREKMGASAREKAVTLFSWDKISQQTLELYDNVSSLS